MAVLRKGVAQIVTPGGGEVFRNLPTSSTVPLGRSSIIVAFILPRRVNDNFVFLAVADPNFQFSTIDMRRSSSDQIAKVFL